MLIVTDYDENDLETFIHQNPSISCEQIQKWSHQILNALIYLQEKHLYPRNLSLKNIRLAQPVRTHSSLSFLNRSSRLGQHREDSELRSLVHDAIRRLRFVSDRVNFPWRFVRRCKTLHFRSDPAYLAPECFAQDLAFKALVEASTSPYESEITDPANPKSCVWAFGIILLELCLVSDGIRPGEPIRRSSVDLGQTAVRQAERDHSDFDEHSLFETERRQRVGYYSSTKWFRSRRTSDEQH